MSNFIDEDHPRGHINNKGSFSERPRTTGGTTLDGDAPSAAEQRLAAAKASLALAEREVRRAEADQFVDKIQAAHPDFERIVFTRVPEAQGLLGAFTVVDAKGKPLSASNPTHADFAPGLSHDDTKAIFGYNPAFKTYILARNTGERLRSLEKQEADLAKQAKIIEAAQLDTIVALISVKVKNRFPDADQLEVEDINDGAGSPYWEPKRLLAGGEVVWDAADDVDFAENLSEFTTFLDRVDDISLAGGGYGIPIN